MDIYDSLLSAVHDEYDQIRLIKKSERGEVILVRHLASENRYIFRHFSGSSEVYQKLLSISCPNLPQIMEVGEKEGKTVLLEEAVLIDFDAARIYKNENREDTQILGTTGFAAPEQYGLSQSDGRADIYALGVLLNIMLTGEHPSRKLASGRMGRIVQRCTMVNPEKRYKNILHLMEVL